MRSKQKLELSNKIAKNIVYLSSGSLKSNYSKKKKIEKRLSKHYVPPVIEHNMVENENFLLASSITPTIKSNKQEVWVEEGEIFQSGFETSFN